MTYGLVISATYIFDMCFLIFYILCKHSISIFAYFYRSQQLKDGKITEIRATSLAINMVFGLTA